MPLTEELLVIRAEPLIAETPGHALSNPTTPSGSVYVRSNFPTPELSEQHRIRIEGAVAAPWSIGIDELRSMPSRTITVTMECAGNDRLGMQPVPDGEPWNHGAISTVTWTGVPLSLLLDRAVPGANALEVVSVGADRGMRDDYDAPVSFARAVPIDVALHQDTLVAYAMNGEPLTPSHGAPARLVVPRWYGMASVKWLESISVVTEPFTGHFQRERYVFELGDRVEPVTTMRVKSFIVSPADGDVVDAGTTRVWGWAFTGNGVVTGVQLSIDGAEWVDAIVDPAISPYAWVRWFADVELRGDAVELRSRARDSSGAIQPDVIEWNRLGYGNNAIRRVRVTVSH